MSGDSAGDLRATVAYVGPADCGCATNLRVLAQFVIPEPPVVETEQPRRVSLLLAAPWSGEPLRVDAQAWDGVPTTPAECARLAAADVVVFVADSHPGRLEDNTTAFTQLERALVAGGGARLADQPHVLQYNNRDLRCVLPVRELREALNRYGVDEVEAASNRGRGVLTTLVLALHAISPRRSKIPALPPP
jgi:hypothetical protein